LAKLVALLASGKDGDVLAAVDALKRTLDAAGLDLNDLAAEILALGEVDTASQAVERCEPGDWFRFIDQLLADTDALSDRDLQFLWSMRRSVTRGRVPTPKQEKWLRDIEAKLTENVA
jgi:hypothetical protein